ncbi:MAG: hypothetical protein JST01_14160 [Cyanobacteria bacterium SZAS TMP-1]|nr:hypothetical protein [Cyanobacteria bacterium SZAS TMP-1]
MSKNNEELREDELFALKLDFNCPYKWKNMRGDDRRRFCGKCKQNVYNISAMTKKEAMELISQNEGGLCVRFFQRRDGTVITRDCTSILTIDGIKAKWNILGIINGSLAALALALAPFFGPLFVQIQQGGAPIMAGEMEQPPEESFESEPSSPTPVISEP